MNEIKFSTRIDINGNTYGMAVDIVNKEIRNNIITSKDDIKLSKKDLNKLADFLADHGFTYVINVKRG